MVKDLLKLRYRLGIAVCSSESGAAQIGGVQTAKVEMTEVESIYGQLITKCDLQPILSVSGLAPGHRG